MGCVNSANKTKVERYLELDMGMDRLTGPNEPNPPGPGQLWPTRNWFGE